MKIALWSVESRFDGQVQDETSRKRGYVKYLGMVERNLKDKLKFPEMHIT